ncbi:MAG: esterase family protein [Clostridiales bacterium]|jgi:S-formylglutathione hydrolase FrmB|nr:esterase family protein [Clostridiales bacterium]
MALYTCKRVSFTLGYPIEYHVFLPDPDMSASFEGIKKLEKPFPVMYLLHGAFDEASCWIRNACVERHAQENGLALVMASALNSFYTDMAHGRPYASFITQELPMMVKSVFPISDKPEETYIAGLSMGGYGALKLALSCPGKYAAAASMSGAVIIESLLKMKSPYVSVEDLFGDKSDSIIGSSHDLRALLKESAEAGTTPRIYQCCGQEDMLYADNLVFRDYAKSLPGLDITWEEGPGGHEWAFWDTYIRKIMRWAVKGQERE